MSDPTNQPQPQQVLSEPTLGAEMSPPEQMNKSGPRPEKHDYSNKEFWNERFLNEKQNDWYISWEQLKPYLEQLSIPADAPILNVGSGNSSVPFDMWTSGLRNITSIDISDTAITTMQKRSDEAGIGCKWVEADATNMKEFTDNTFDVVIDKGTLDALVCDNDDLIPTRMIQEMFRVTKVGGHMFIITHSAPSQRAPLFNKCLEGLTCEITYCRQSLEKSVNMVNAIRCYSGGLSLGQLIKDPALFVETLKKFKADEGADQPVGLGWKPYKLEAEGEKLISQTEDAPALYNGIPRQSYCFVIK